MIFIRTVTCAVISAVVEFVIYSFILHGKSNNHSQ